MSFEEAKEVKPGSNWIDCHSHQFIPAQHPKPIDVDGVQYMPGVYNDSGFPHEDWAAQFYQEVGGEG